MADEQVYIVRSARPRLFASLSEYFQSIAAFGPPLPAKSLPGRLDKLAAAAKAAREAKKEEKKEEEKKTDFALETGADHEDPWTLVCEDEVVEPDSLAAGAVVVPPDSFRMSAVVVGQQRLRMQAEVIEAPRLRFQATVLAGDSLSTEIDTTSPPPEPQLTGPDD